MRVLVTGGAGFIGGALCRALVRDGVEVLNLDKLTYAASPAALSDTSAAPNYRFVEGDVANRALVDGLLADFKPDAIMHLAAESHVDRSITGSAPFIQTNVIGTHVMLEAALALWSANPSAPFRFLHISTDEVFGSLGEDGLFSEDTRYDPHSPYSASKAASDHLVRAWGHTYGLPILISNCSNNYGPYQFPEKFIPLMILNALEGKPLPIYGDGLNVRDWLHVEDHVAALRLMLERGAPGETYAIGGRAERTNRDVAHAICDLIDELAPDPAIGSRRLLLTAVEDRRGHDRRYAIDCSKIERDLGWRTSRSFEEGLRSTIAWYIANKDWWGPIRAHKYAGERLGLR